MPAEPRASAPLAEAEYIEATQGFVDAICHYRNLAISLGAKPEQMRNHYDRWLCETTEATDIEDWKDNERLRGLVHTTCAAFGHLWPDPPSGWFRRWKEDRSRRCAACGVHRRCVDQEVEK